MKRECAAITLIDEINIPENCLVFIVRLQGGGDGWGQNYLIAVVKKECGLKKNSGF